MFQKWRGIERNQKLSAQIFLDNEGRIQIQRAQRYVAKCREIRKSLTRIQLSVEIMSSKFKSLLKNVKNKLQEILPDMASIVAICSVRKGVPYMFWNVRGFSGSAK